MKTKIICAVLALTLAVAGLSACGGTETAADTTAQYAASVEDGQNPVMNFVGNYQFDRYTMLVEAQGMDEARITVHGGSDAWTYAEWTMSGQVVEKDGELVMKYIDGVTATVTVDEDGNETRTDEMTDGKGTIKFKSDNTIVWTDNRDDTIKNLVFEWLPVVSEEEVYTG